MNGGIDAWNGLVSKASVGQGMYLLEGNETIEQIIALAYGLEKGSRRFYRKLAERSAVPEAKRLFETLYDAEMQHEERLWERYRALVENGGERTEFDKIIVPRALEGGQTPDQVLSMYPEAGKDFAGSLDLAMALETDALDLYLRMATAFDGRQTRSVFIDLAEEEREHLKELGKLRGEVVR